MSTRTFIGKTEFFPGIGRIPFEGPESDNPLAFKAYDENRDDGEHHQPQHDRVGRQDDHDRVRIAQRVRALLLPRAGR